MRVELAYPYEGHEPDEIIEVDRQTGRNLVSAGRARPAADAPDKSWTVDDLVAYLDTHGIPLPARNTKAALLAAIGETTAPPTNPPAEAAEPKETA